jgi:hypothetical protein
MSAEDFDLPQDAATPSNLPQEILARGGLSLGQVARRFPPYRGDRPGSPSTVWRWIVVGVRLADGSRLRLEAVRLSGRWLTSEPALARFIRAQTPQLDADPATPPRTPGQRSRAAEWAAEELDRLDI